VTVVRYSVPQDVCVSAELPEAYDADRVLLRAAESIVTLLWHDRDLVAAWPSVDRLLRTVWAQQWLYPLRDVARRDGFAPDDVVSAFIAADPSGHPLWGHFEEQQMRALLAMGDVERWGAMSRSRLVAVDVEAVLFLPPTIVGRPGPVVGTSWVNKGKYFGVAIMMRRGADGVWRMVNFTSDSSVPSPGWPPTW